MRKEHVVFGPARPFPSIARMVGLSVRPILDFPLPLLFFGGVMGLRKLKGASSTIRKEEKKIEGPL